MNQTSKARRDSKLRSALLLSLAVGAWAQPVWAARSEQEKLLASVFGEPVVEQLKELPPARFAGARERAVGLAYLVRDREMKPQVARDQLAAALRHMDRGEPLDDLADPSVLVVGKIPVGMTPKEQAKAEAAAIPKYSVSAVKKTSPAESVARPATSENTAIDSELDRQ